ncbi:MAG: hypothetical protein V4642_00710 [Bacteroidota bacterium]
MEMPLFVLEIWYVILASPLIGLLKTLTYSSILKQKANFSDIVLFALTTIGCYFFQGFCRLLLGVIIYGTTNQYFSSYPVIRGILGNVGIYHGYTPRLAVGEVSTLATSIIASFLLSVLVESRLVLKIIDGNTDKSQIKKSVLTSNIIAHILLTVWIIYKYMSITRL